MCDAVWTLRMPQGIARKSLFPPMEGSEQEMLKRIWPKEYLKAGICALTEGLSRRSSELLAAEDKICFGQPQRTHAACMCSQER